MRLRFVLTTALLALLGAAGAASGPQDKLDLALRDGKALGHQQRVILKAAPGAEARLRQLLAARGTRIESELRLVGAITVTLSAPDLVALCEQSPLVRSCAINGEVTSLGAKDVKFGARKKPGQPAPSTTATSTMLGTLGLPHARAAVGTTGGDGVTVALIDSGIDPMLFAGRITASRDFTRSAKPDSDEYGHGTHLAGLIGGSQTLPGDAEYQGVAPGVKFVALKVLDWEGKGFTDDVIAAIEFAIENKDELGIDIINLSLGHPIYAPAANDFLVQAVELASQAGIIVVVSAGNYGADAKGKLGYAGITSPGNAPSAITVGAVDHNGTLTIGDNRVADYSSSGPTWYDGYAKPDVVAPGHHLASQVAAGSTLENLKLTRPELFVEGSGKQFMHLSGTSMSTAVTTGVVALLKQQRAGLTPNLAKGLLQYTAIPLHNDRGRVYTRLRQGTGEVNAAGALALAGAIDPHIATLDPTEDNTKATRWVDGSMTAQSTRIGRSTYAWASSVVWGNNVVWGETVLYNLPVWGLNVVWGNSIKWGDSVVWGNGLDAGDNVVWGHNVVWGDNVVWGNKLVWAKNVVWGHKLLGVKAAGDDNVVWGHFEEDSVVWGNLDDDSVVWGNLFDDNVVWGHSDDNVVWGNDGDHSIVWGNVVLTSGKGGK